MHLGEGRGKRGLFHSSPKSYSMKPLLRFIGPSILLLAASWKTFHFITGHCLRIFRPSLLKKILFSGNPADNLLWGTMPSVCYFVFRVAIIQPMILTDFSQNLMVIMKENMGEFNVIVKLHFPIRVYFLRHQFFISFLHCQHPACLRPMLFFF